ncbi:hypothetical protein E4T66_16065 [Sinimarinibacterium sp. CAU 1509]|uniref:hypothetical protein n=1 Tax=Sinimarinibacterium sp. CAU 1509 TaxID=2562283 RepID=UPI0010AC941E|nr:hypothetical protein [Sinimarinibacterium sp. CAU 1509]TJY58211.1 hypothetical protein E4T66_16065 [Sinimarinibacterium sp. CAU 1509]
MAQRSIESALRGQQADIVSLGAKQVVLTHWDDFTSDLIQPIWPIPLVFNLAPVFDHVRRECRDLNVVLPVLGQPMGIRHGDENAALPY